MLYYLLLLIPLTTGIFCLFLNSLVGILLCLSLGVFSSSAVGYLAAMQVFTHGALSAAGGWLFLDELSAYHLLLMLVIFFLSTLYSWGYLGEEMRSSRITLRDVRLFGGLWSGALAAMTLVLLSNNLGMIWVGIEGTTLLTAFLICIPVKRTSLEAMWKYLMICSVGVAFAFIGTLLVAAAANKFSLSTADALLWTKLRDHASEMEPTLLKAGFLFMLIGYGTKAGIAPMHSWLPDAHSQAPAPVSAIFSGFMLNTALYCVMRHLPLVEIATGNSGWSSRLLTGFGLLSMLVSAAFIIFQHDLKRLLAYHSVEHIGIITLGLGLGGPLGTFAALFHTMNHSICKTLSFFAAGRLGQIYQTHDMSKMSGALQTSPLWGAGLLGSLLALIGMAPFAIFMSEFQILKAAVDNGSFITLVLFLLGAGIVFVGALRHAIDIAWGTPQPLACSRKNNGLDVFLALGPLAVLLILGLWLPQPLAQVINLAARIIGAKS
jgi:hydrogenase-4 component F